MEIRENEKAADGYRKVRLVAAVQAVPLVVYVAMVELVTAGGFKPSPVWSQPDLVRVVLLALSMGLFVASGLLRERMLRPRFEALEEALVPGERLRRMVAANVVAFALCETPALLGLIFFFLGGTRTDFYLFAVLTAIFLILRLPSDRQWQAWYAQRTRLR